MNSKQCKHFNVRWLRSALLVLLTATGACSGWAAGVTVITHGYGPSFLGYPAWVDTMAQAVTNAAFSKGLSCSWYHLEVRDNGSSAVISRVSTATASQSSEVVFTVDWSDIADYNEAGGGGLYTTADVAAWIAGGLLTAYPALGLDSPLAAQPTHLIGHSRGGSAVLETAKLLGAHGVWVDQVTTLDPHPLTPPDYGIGVFHPADPPARLYENVIFADNYWRSDLDPLDFDGQAIPGAEDVQFNESILAGGWLGDPDGEHSKVHTWYGGGNQLG